MWAFFLAVNTDNNAKRDANGPALLKTLRNIERLLKNLVSKFTQN